VLPFGHDLVNGIGQFRFVRTHAEEGIACGVVIPESGELRARRRIFA
jgi:hypothetical protein